MLCFQLLGTGIKNFSYGLEAIILLNILNSYLAVKLLACKKGKRGGTSEGRVENGKMDVWCEVTR